MMVNAAMKANRMTLDSSHLGKRSGPTWGKD